MSDDLTAFFIKMSTWTAWLGMIGFITLCLMNIFLQDNTTGWRAAEAGILWIVAAFAAIRLRRRASPASVEVVEGDENG